jgi:hypothetical protein
VVFEWHSYFKASQVSVEDNKHSLRPRIGKMTENVENIRELIHEDSRQTIHELVDTFWIRSFPGDLNKKFEHATHCCDVCSLSLDK